MAKPDRRNQRKKEKLRRSKAWESRTRLVQRHDFIADFGRLCKQEVDRHASLLGIEELHENDEARKLEGADFLCHFGYGGYVLHEWDTNSADGYDSNMPNRDGGFVQAVEDSAGGLHTVVFINTREGDKWALAAMNIAALYHEIGHVDDIEKGVNFRIGEPVDLARAESYAHRFACSRMLEQNLKGPLAYYLTRVVDQLKRSDAKLIRAAALAFEGSPEYARARNQNKLYVEAFECESA